MASHNVSFGAWMLDLVSEVHKLHVLVDSTSNDLERWELGLFKVLEAQGILYHVNKLDSSRTPVSESSHAENFLALALINLTIDESVKEKLLQPIDDTGNARLIYAEIRENYMEFIELERSYQNERAGQRVEMRAYHTEKKNILEKTIKEKKKELVELEGEVAALEKKIEQTYLPEWNDW
ncbi:hypothetical protein B0T18DRAFT_427213 [Schizothecium vesticola]|uniref:Uncharacterized protein n=1 Tax=Schizothecium vesticola TaxID=314040 RepID=A0AA40F128_9PEZI|nr:hypothetical protein B0T18DRAFT_427213 [Schizothecium vesticola]